MSKTLTGFALLACVLVAGLVLAQGNSPAPAPDSAGIGRYIVVPTGGTAILVDSQSGKTWVKHTQPGTKADVWLAASRVDDSDQAAAILSQINADERELAAKAKTH